MNPLMFLLPIIEGVVTKAGVPAALISTITKAVGPAIMASPAAVNQMNLEPIHTSRVAQGSFGALVIGIATAIYGWSIKDTAVMGTGLASAIAAGWALYGRVASGLTPVGTKVVTAK